MPETFGQKVEDFFGGVEKTAVKDWGIFLQDITYLTKEATIIGNWIAKEDPAIVQAWQTFLTAAEAKAASLVSAGQGGLKNVISDGVDLAEQYAANAIQSAGGNSAVGVSAGALATDGLTFLGTTIENMATVGFTKAVAALASAAQSGQKAAGSTGATGAAIV